jgi:transposase
LPINYSWTKKGKQKHIDKINDITVKSNVLGLFDYKKEELTYSSTQDKMDSEMFIGLFDLAKHENEIPVCVVIDNYSIHTSKITKIKKLEWEKQGIFFYHIPPYSPELNLIENIWHILKYYCMPKRNFDNPNDLELAIKEGITKLNNKT